MSNELRSPSFQIADVVGPTGRRVLVDTSLLTDGRYETMVFRMKRNKVDYGADIDVQMSADEESARRAHQAMVDKWQA